MSATQNWGRSAPFDERKAFDVWFGRTIRDIYEPVIHEELPDEIIRALPPTAPER